MALSRRVLVLCVGALLVCMCLLKSTEAEGGEVTGSEGCQASASGSGNECRDNHDGDVEDDDDDDIDDRFKEHKPHYHPAHVPGSMKYESDAIADDDNDGDTAPSLENNENIIVMGH